jgi:hypothetical protein
MENNSSIILCVPQNSHVRRVVLVFGRYGEGGDSVIHASTKSFTHLKI